eukprot:TRINITY_DN93739_c0_g1_i1.p1 TRINITY_DN93739_c0_g1~~TRINITY_DN93739_c0_g1_i1.p1  ORF type:complete len:333 (+),score=66.75 TRINITY_DN93739_c0_g1_i1:52-999(+)
MASISNSENPKREIETSATSPSKRARLYDEASLAPLCRFFLSPGGCAYGAACRNRHEEGGSVPAKAECVFFAQGRCTRGESCVFAHTSRDFDLADGVAAVEENTSESAEVPPCIFFMRGECKRGKQCLFPHIGSSKASGSTTSPKCSDEASELCRHFNTPRGCRNGDACRFIHSAEEPVHTSLTFFDPYGEAEDAADGQRSRAMGEGSLAGDDATSDAKPRSAKDILKKYSASSVGAAAGADVRIRRQPQTRASSSAPEPAVTAEEGAEDATDDYLEDEEAEEELDEDDEEEELQEQEDPDLLPEKFPATSDPYM